MTVRNPAAVRARRPELLGAALLAASLASAILFRIYLLLVADFPINDGALFLEFVRGISATFPTLPETVAYNGLVLPFAYPPLSFWLGALLTKLGFDSLEVVRVVPILMNIVYLLLFALVLVKSGRSRLFVGLATLFFSVTLLSFEWLLMGGGLSRGLGAIFLMLTLLSVTVPDAGRAPPLGIWRMVLAGVTTAGAILSHLEWGILAAGSVVLSRALGSRDLKEFVVSCAVAGATALCLISPWLFWIHRTHGLGPFLAAGSTGGWSPKFIIVRLLEVAIDPTMTNPFVLLGGFVLLIRKQWFWIGFILLCAILTPRHAPTPLTLPVAVFAAQGVVRAYAFGARFISSRKLMPMAVLVVAALLSYGIYRTQLEAGRYFRVLPNEMREAMAWVSAHRPASTFAIVNDRDWAYDYTGEWFPTLASARSVTTVQGREWTGDFRRWDALSKALRASGTCEELLANLRRFGAFRHVWVQSRHECFAGPEYRMIYSNPAVSIFQFEESERRQ